MDADPPAAKKSGPPVPTDNDPLAGKRELTDRPSDDWGTRYGLQNQGPGPFVHTNKSWITPSFPSFDRRAANNPRHFPNHFLDHDHLLKDGVPAPIDSEADRLFTSERIQQHKFAGLRTWEAALLQDVRAYQSGNELAGGCMISQRLAVRENGWFPVFEKHRWIDYNIKVSESGVDVPRKHGGCDAIWSVDNPAVWEELRPCIELANRLLCMATRGPWLSSLLDSSAHETSNGVWYSMDWEAGEVNCIASSIRRFVNVDPSRRLSPATVSDLLKTTDHLISWSFFGGSDEKSTPEAYRGQSPCIVDCQVIEQSGKSQMTISLDVALLKPLMSWNLNVTDKAVIQHTIGVNLLLAYADALARSRGLQFLEEEMKLNPGLQKPRQYQMFFGDEITADHKASFSNSLFGAKLEFPLYQSPSVNKTGFQVITTAREFPLEEDVLKQLFAVGEVPAPSWYKHLDPHKVHKHTSYPVPNIWQASMMNEDFWKVHVAKFGLKALQVPKDIQTENFFHPAWSMKSSLPINTSLRGESERQNVTFKDLEGDKVKILPTARRPTGQTDTDAATRLGRQLENRRILWDEMRREWYPDMHADWAKLPHANIDFREDLRLITEKYFVRRSDFDEFRAHEIARRWIAMGNFAHGGDNNIPLTFRRNALMCRAIGLAVMGALPARTTEKRCLRTGTVDMRKGAEKWRLSKEARASKAPIKPFETWWADDPAPEFVLPERHKARPKNKVVDSRITVLEDAMRALKEYEAQKGATSAVSRPLRAQIRHCLHVLKDNSLTEMLSAKEEEMEWEDDEIPTMGPERWLEMFFRLSDYTYSKGPAPPSQVPAKNLVFSKEALEEIGDKEPSPSRVDHTLQEPLKVNWWSVGQVAEQNSMANLWVLVWTGREYWVYNVTPCILRLRWREADMEQHIQYTEHGRVLKHGLEGTFGKQYIGFAKCKGRLKRWYRESDLALMGPKDRKIRVAIGEHVYSTSDVGSIHWHRYGISQDAERAITKAITRSKPGSLYALESNGHGEYSWAVQKALKRYRCGRIKAREFPVKEGPLYTLDELSWFCSERTGMYTAINGTVYDLTDFFKWHPGGRTVLREHAVGKDATEVFNKWHAPGLEESIRNLAVGRIIQWHEEDTYAHDEFLINNYVYKLGIPKGKKLDNTTYLHRLYKASSWFGAAADEFARSGNEAALRLARHTELIVAKRPVVKDLPCVSIEDVSECQGFAMENMENMAWIAVGSGTYARGYVYDITSIVNNPFHEFEKAKLLVQCGRKTDNVAIARWLRERHRGRIVAAFGPIFPVFEGAEPLLCKKGRPLFSHQSRDEESTPKKPAEGQEGAGGLTLAKVGDLSPDVEMAGTDVTLPPVSEKNAWDPSCHSLANERAEQQRLEIYEDELKHQEQLRAEAREQLKREYPQTPLVQVRPLAKGEKPPPGRDPVGTGKDKHKLLPPLPEVWPYGVSSMFKDKWTPEMKTLAAAYVADQILPTSRGASTPHMNESQLPKEMVNFLHNRIAPILTSYAGKSEDNDFGDPGVIREGEDEWIAELKRLGTLFDEAFLREFSGQVAEDSGLQELEERVHKRKRGAEEGGRELKRPKLLGTPKRKKSVRFASPEALVEVGPGPPLYDPDSEETDEEGSTEDEDVEEEGEGEEEEEEEGEEEEEEEEESEEEDEDEEEESDEEDEESDEEDEDEDEGGVQQSPSSPESDSDDDGDGWSGYTDVQHGESSPEEREEQDHETWGSLEREIEEQFLARAEGLPDETQNSEVEETHGGDHEEDVEMDDAPGGRLAKDEGDWERAGFPETIARADAVRGTPKAEDITSPQQSSIATSPEATTQAASLLETLYPENNPADSKEWYEPEAQPTAPQHGDPEPEPRAEKPLYLQINTKGHRRRPTKEEISATIKENLPHLLDVERAVAQQAEKIRVEGMKGLQLREHLYRGLGPRVPREMWPSEFSLGLREYEAAERAKWGPLAAARDEYGRRL